MQTERAPAPLLTAAEVAELLQVTERTLEFWRYQGRGPAFLRLEKRVRYRPSDVEAYLQTRRQGGDASP